MEPIGRPKATQMIEPMDTYKVFMMRQDENATPETYQQRYEEYKKKYVQRLMRAFFDDHKKEDWMQERYSPAIRFRSERQKKISKITEAKSFGDRLKQKSMKIDLAEKNELSGKGFDNDMEDSSRILYIRRVPCACPVGCLSDTIRKAGGAFLHLYLSDPVKKSAFDFDRSAYIIYDTAAAAAEALPKVHNTFVEDGDLFAPFRLQISQHRSRAPLKTPSYLAAPNRLEFDFEQALSLAKALDQAVFLNKNDIAEHGIEALLASEPVMEAYPSNKQKLDVIIAYLRRVHHYIYYAGIQCLDMGDIMHAHPALFCRPEPSERDLAEDKARTELVQAEEGSDQSKSVGGWAAGLDEKVQAYMKQLEPDTIASNRQKQQVLVDEIEKREEAALESTYANYAEKAGEDGKHRCRLCTKLFKAIDFVKKHIRNKHPELVVDKIADVGENYMWEQYREDPNRPLPPVETTNTLSKPILGSRGQRSRPEGPNFNGNRKMDEPFNYRRAPYPPRGGGRSYSRTPGMNSPRRPPPDVPVDPRQITTSYRDLDNLQDTKVELSFDALDTLPPPKKKTKI
ncbi:hypothetical protein ABG067_002879 [Albugo candida]